MAIVYRSVKGTNLTPTEVDNNFSEIGTVSISTSNTMLFDKIGGYRHGTWATPLTGALVLDTTGAVEGGCAVAIWNGSSNPTISGGTIESLSGNITTSGTYSIYFHYLNGRFNVNIFNVSGGVTDTTAPTLTSATIEDAAPTNVVMVFSEAVTMTDLVDNGFTLAGTTSTVFSSISGSGTTWTGVLGSAATNGETITLSYSSATGDVVDGNSNILATFTGNSVTNNIAGNFALNFVAASLHEALFSSWTPPAGDWSVSFDLITKGSTGTTWLMGSNTAALTAGALEIRNAAANAAKLRVHQGTVLETGNTLVEGGKTITIDHDATGGTIGIAQNGGTRVSVTDAAFVPSAITLIFGCRSAGDAYHSDMKIANINLNGETGFLTEGTGTLSTGNSGTTITLSDAAMWDTIA